MSRSTVSHPQPKRYGDPKKLGSQETTRKHPKRYGTKRYRSRKARKVEFQGSLCDSIKTLTIEKVSKTKKVSKKKVSKSVQISVLSILSRFRGWDHKERKPTHHVVASKRELARQCDLHIDTVSAALAALEIQEVIWPHPDRGWLLGSPPKCPTQSDTKCPTQSDILSSKCPTQSDNGYNQPLKPSLRSDSSDSSCPSLPSVETPIEEEFPPPAAAALPGATPPALRAPPAAAAEGGCSPSVDEVLGTFLEQEEEKKEEVQIPSQSIPFRKRLEEGYEIGFILGAYQGRDQDEKFKYRTFGITACYLGLKIGDHDRWIPWESWNRMIKVACDSLEEIQDLQGSEISERDVPFLVALRVHMRASERLRKKQRPMGPVLVENLAGDLSKIEIDAQGPWTPGSRGLGFSRVEIRDQEYDQVLNYCFGFLNQDWDYKKVDGHKIYRSMRARKILK